MRLYVFHSLLSRLYFFLPILVLWFQEQGFSQFQITILLSTFFLSTTLAEVPTGIFSDRSGHRWAMALCGLFQAAGVFLLAFASQFSIAVLGEILMGIGQAFYTGSKEAFLFNALEEDRLHHLYQRDYAQAKFFEFIGMAVGSLVGGSVYVLWPRSPFFLSTVAFLTAAALALRLKDAAKKEGSPPPTLKHLLSGIEEIRAGGVTLKTLIAYYGLFFSSILIFIVTLIQPYLKEAGIPLSLFGVVFFFFQVASMGGSLVARRLPNEWLTGRFFALLSLGFAAVLLTLGFFRHPFSILPVSLAYLTWGIFLPTTSNAVNRLIRSERRATVLSAQDFLQNLIFVISAPLIGWAADIGGLSISLWILGAGGLLISLLALRI